MVKATQCKPAWVSTTCASSRASQRKQATQAWLRFTIRHCGRARVRRTGHDSAYSGVPFPRLPPHHAVPRSACLQAALARSPRSMEKAVCLASTRLARPSHAVSWRTTCATYCWVNACMSAVRRLLIGWGKAIYGCPGMPLARNWNSAARWKACVMTTAAGIPRCSKAIVSCTQHNVHEPQPPTAAMATCTSCAIAAISASVAGFE